jgi:hypothetical protein
MKELAIRFKAAILWVSVTAFTVAAYFGFRCPAPGCPCCKMVGK